MALSVTTLAGVRGTLIICDQVYQDRSGKFVIAGTYSAWRTRDDELRLSQFNAYLRLQLDRAGDFPCRIVVVDRMAPPNQQPLVTTSFTLVVNEAQLPVYEASLRLPELRIRAPRPLSEREPGSIHGIRTLVMLTVGEVDVASCPMDFLFVGNGVP